MYAHKIILRHSKHKGEGGCVGAKETVSRSCRAPAHAVPVVQAVLLALHQHCSRIPRFRHEPNTLPKPCTAICPAMQGKRPEKVHIIPLELQAMLEQSLSLQLERNVVPVTRI